MSAGMNNAMTLLAQMMSGIRRRPDAGEDER